MYLCIYVCTYIHRYIDTYIYMYIHNTWQMAEVLLEKKNTKSVIWKYFDLEADDEGNPKDADSPKCKLCFQKVTACFGNTSNLYSHIRTTHPIVHKDLQAEKAEKPPTKSRKSEQQDSEDSTGQMTVKECLGKGKKLSKDSWEFKELTRSVSECLAKEMLPLNTVDRAGFRAMLHTFNPRYTLPTRSYSFILFRNKF